MRLQKWSFALIFLLDAFTWPLDVLIWPYILHLVIDIFADYETNRLAAGTALKNPIIAGLCLVVAIESTIFHFQSRARTRQKSTTERTENTERDFIVL